MIKFIPKLVDAKSPISDPEGFTNNIYTKGFASHMNATLEGKFCPKHPEFENTIFVFFQKDKSIMTVESYCCDKFKIKLDLIADNKNPFDEKGID